MKINIIKDPEVILQSNTYFYKELKKTRKICIVLANKYEFIDFKYTSMYFKNIKTDQSNMIKNKNFDKTDEEIIKYKMLPLVKIDNIKYTENLYIGYMSQLHKFSNNCDIHIVKTIGPNEIINGNLVAPEQINFFLEEYNKCKTFTTYQYIDFKNKDIPYENFIHNYPTELLTNVELDATNVKKKYNMVVVQFAKLSDETIKYSELHSLPINIYLTLLSLDTLEKGGDLYVEYTPMKYKTSCQILSIISDCFDTCDFINNETSLSSGFYKFSRYNEKNEKLKEVYLEYIKKDKSVGKNHFVNKNNSMYFDLDVVIPFDFFDFLQDISLKNYKKSQKFLEKVRYINDFIKIKFKIYQIIDQNIDVGLKFTKKYNIPITKNYHNFYEKIHEEMNTYETKLRMFPKMNLTKTEINKLMITPASLFSVSSPKSAQEISDIIKKYRPEVKSIADMTANVGGNSINFCNNFEKVYSIEIDKPTHDALNNNLTTYGFTNFETFNKSCLDFDKHADIYFYDPEWSGVLYRMEPIIQLYIDSKNIVDVIKHNFCMKVPNNFDLFRLLSKFPELIIHKIKNYILIINIQSNYNRSNKKHKLNKHHNKNKSI
jgi:hypothetical protein